MGSGESYFNNEAERLDPRNVVYSPNANVAASFSEALRKLDQVLDITDDVDTLGEKAGVHKPGDLPRAAALLLTASDG